MTLNSSVVGTSQGELMVSDNQVSLIEPSVPLREVSEYLSKALRAASFGTPEKVNSFIEEFENHFNEIIDKAKLEEEERYERRMEKFFPDK